MRKLNPGNNPGNPVRYMCMGNVHEGNGTRPPFSLWAPPAGLTFAAGLSAMHGSHKSHIVGHMWLFMYVLTCYYKKNSHDKCSHDASFVGKHLTNHSTHVESAVSAAHV